MFSRAMLILSMGFQIGTVLGSCVGASSSAMHYCPLDNINEEYQASSPLGTGKEVEEMRLSLWLSGNDAFRSSLPALVTSSGSHQPVFESYTP
jgi:hypothetical protein